MSGEWVGFDMAELSSCYFCGAALDTALERQEVAATGGEATTVVLCPSCRRKLVAVLDRTLDAEPDAESDSLLGAAAGDASATPDDPGDDAPAVADVTPDQGSTTPDATAPESEEHFGIAGEEAGEGDTTGATGGTDLGTTSDDGGASGGANGATGATAVGGSDEPIFGTGETDDRSEDGSVGGDGADDETPVGNGTADEAPGETATEVYDAESAAQGRTPVRNAEPDADEGDDADVADGADEPDGKGDDADVADSKGDDADEPDAVGSPTPPDAETYNRVVRLLQNRDFPVPTAEIEEVALNAYDIAPEDFRAVIDTAVDRGVLAEDGGQLTLPD